MTKSVRMFTAAQAATYLGVCTESVRRAYRRGALKGVKDNLAQGSPVRYTGEDLDAYRQSRLG